MQRWILRKGSKRPVTISRVVAVLERLDEEAEWELRLIRYRRTRSEAQNNALWGVAYPPICEATGYTLDELHDAMCRRFFGEVEREVLGFVFLCPARSTTRGPDGKRDVISTTEFMDFYRMVQEVGAERGVDVPDPDPEWWRHGED